MGRVLRHFARALFLGAISNVAFAYVPTLSSNGAQVHWNSPVKFNLAGNSSNQSGIQSSDFYNAVVTGLQRWKTASGGSVNFDYWQGTDPSVYMPNSSYNGESSIYFASNTSGGADNRLTPSILGLTQVWYDTNTGQILESDTVLNDKDFNFTMNPKDTSGYGSGSTSFSNGKPNVYIENVITHEFGHALGLAHSGGMQSTMLFMESPEQAHLGCDEQIAIRALYPAGDVGSRGVLRGTVLSQSGNPVFGAHVEAISRRRGTVLASALTNQSGQYSISALEPGDYFILAEPFLAGAQALPAYYSSIQDDVCPNGHSFGRTLLVDSGGNQPLWMSVGSGGNITQAPPLTVQCSGTNGAAIADDASASSASTAPQIYDGTSGTKLNGFGMSDRFTGSNTKYYLLHALSGHVEIHALSYSLYSPIHPALSLLDSNGNPVSGQSVDKVYTGDSGYVNYDSAFIADGLPSGDYYIQVTATSLNVTLYPAGPILLDTAPFLVITGSVNEPSPALAGTLPFNARCRMDENFAPYSSPPGNPPIASQGGQNGGKVGFCGSLSTTDRNSDSSQGPPLSAVIGWLLPWFAMAAVARLARFVRAS